MSYSENNSFEKIMSRMLERNELIDVDKRQGSIIYDTLAPCAMELAEAYIMMDILQEQTYLLSATGTNLDKRAYDYGISRMQGSKAQRIGEFKKYLVDEFTGEYVLDDNDERILVDMDIPIGSRFMVPDNANIVFKYTGDIDNNKILECESEGTGGNEHIGIILPLVPITDMVEAKITSTYKYGEDEETDDELRLRVQEHITNQAFGGNIADYIEKVNSIDGVGNTKVFPAWEGGGSVLLSVVDPTYNPISSQFADSLKEQIDPEDGNGVGIAPIGHIVTITTPVEETVDVELTLAIEENAVQGEITSEVETVLREYFQSVRKEFAQDVSLAIYRARIIDVLFDNISDILNVTNVLLNNTDADIVYTDEGLIGYQYLPKLGEVTVNYE
jgi:uncharacterized phage protein gp47/JayE